MTSINQSEPVNVSPNPNAPVAKSTFDVKAVAIEIARLLSDDKCTDITLLDVRGISSVQDFVILASGTSDRQMRSAASDVKNLLPTLGSSVFRTSIDDQSTWIVVDCVDTVIHIFEPNTRSYYDLESMWGDAPKVEWLREGQTAYTAESAAAEVAEPGDSDEPAAAQTFEASEPDADLELTTASAETFVEDVRASVSRKPAAAPKAKKAKPAAKANAKPAPRAAKPAKKAAAKKAAPAKKVAKKAPAKKAAKAVKKAPAKAAKKAAKKTAKKAGKKK